MNCGSVYIADKPSAAHVASVDPNAGGTKLVKPPKPKHQAQMEVALKQARDALKNVGIVVHANNSDALTPSIVQIAIELFKKGV